MFEAPLSTKYHDNQNCTVYYYNLLLSPQVLRGLELRPLVVNLSVQRRLGLIQVVLNRLELRPLRVQHTAHNVEQIKVTSPFSIDVPRLRFAFCTRLRGFSIHNYKANNIIHSWCQGATSTKMSSASLQYIQSNV